MGIIQQIRDAFRVAPPAPRQGQKASVFSFPSWLTARPRWNIDDRFEDYVADGYKLNSLIYAPIRYKARAYSSVPLVAAIGDPDNPEWLPPDHPLSRLCVRPNKRQAWRAFAEQRKTYLELAGNNYTYVERGKGGEVLALWNLRPDRVRILPGTRDIKGYYYLPPGKPDDAGVPLLPEDVIHTKYPNPSDELEGLGYGLPPLLAAARDADTDNSVTAFIKLLFDRGAMPMGILRFETSLSDDDADLAKRRFMDKYGGFERWNEPIVMDQGGNYERIGMTFQELGFEVLDARNESRILSTFGVPPILLGTRYGIAHGTYSNYNEARTQFWQDVLVPELRLFEDDDQVALTSSDGAYVLYDLSVVPALQVDTAKLVDAAHKMWTMGVPANRAFTAVGLIIEDVEGGDTPYIPKGVVDVREPSAGASDEPADADADLESARANLRAEDGSPKAAAPDFQKDDALVEGRTTEDKARLWKAMDDIAVAHEPEFMDEAAAQFELDRREVMVIVGEAKAKALREKATINWTPVLDDVSDVIKAAGDRWREAFAPMVAGVVEDAAEFWRVEAGLAFNVARLEDQAWFTDYMLQFGSPITDTSERELAGIIQRGIREGWSIQQMQDAIEKTFDQWIEGKVNPADIRFAVDRLPPWRTEMIARTETTRATSAGAYQVYRGAGVQRKEWLSTPDERTRPTHMDAMSQIRNIDELFDIGGYKMMHPGDASFGAPPEEFVNCRCSIAPIIED